MLRIVVEYLIYSICWFESWNYSRHLFNLFSLALCFPSQARTLFGVFKYLEICRRYANWKLFSLKMKCLHEICVMVICANVHTRYCNFKISTDVKLPLGCRLVSLWLSINYHANVLCNFFIYGWRNSRVTSAWRWWMQGAYRWGLIMCYL